MKNSKMMVNFVLIMTLLIPSLSGLSSAGQPASDVTDGSRMTATVPDEGYTISGRVMDGHGNPLAGVTITATITEASRDYRPQADGYKFINWKRRTNWEIFRQTFGARNVEWAIGSKTIRKPSAQWYFSTGYKCDCSDYLSTLSVTNPENHLGCMLAKIGCSETGMNGSSGGMSASSMLLYKYWAEPVDFLIQQRASQVVNLAWPGETNEGLWNSTPVSDFILRYQGYQQGGQVQAERSEATSRTLTETLQLIKSSINGGLTEPQLIEIFGPGGNSCAGHALTPYAYRMKGDVAYISVYDSNHPYSTLPTVIITPTTNTWSYNHQNSIGIWQSGQVCGWGTSRIEVIPVSAYRQSPIPPWSVGSAFQDGSSQVEAESRYELTAGKNGLLTILDDQRRTVGVDDGQLALEIPGSYLDIPLSVIPGQPEDHAERYVIPSSSPLTVTLTYAEGGQSLL